MLSKRVSKAATVAKLIAIILVIYIHADVNVRLIDNKYQALNNIEYIFSQIISRSAVPMFFLISGFFSVKQIDRPYLLVLKKKFKSLLIPYVFWNILWIIIYFCGQKISFLAPYFQNPEKNISTFGIEQYLHAFGLITINNSSRPFLYPLWFLRDLLIINLFFPFIKIIIKNKAINKCMILFLFLGYLSSIKIGIIEVQGIFFFLLGLTIAKEDYDISQNKLNNVILALFIYIILVYLKFKFQLMYSLELSNMIGTFLIWKISLRLINSKIVMYLSNFTMIIFLFHEWNLSFLRKIILKIFDGNSASLIFCYFVLPWIIICFSISIGIYLKKYFFTVYNFITGNR